MNAVVDAQRLIGHGRARAAVDLSTGKYLPQAEPAIAKALTYRQSEYQVRHPDWQPQQLGFEAFPYAGFSERLVTEMQNTVVDGDRRFLDRLDAASVHADLVDDRFVRSAIDRSGGPVALGLPASLTRIEQVQP
ncbi:hypothetical protein BKA16_000240 [Gordonia humi]|uniref:Uncharacterized protein n=1 Tax=Gordonia humi TaxID=686429 RepID=A0A840ETK5_9ACTN|nr:hypothetical protein [Gordonia humi]